MLVAAAVCPCPPLLVPAVAAGARSELRGTRAACADALGVLAAARPDRLIVVGPAGEAARGAYPGGATGSFAGFGVDVRVRLGESAVHESAVHESAVHESAAHEGDVQETDDSGAPGAPVAPGTAPPRALPASLAVAAWLLEQARWTAAPVTGLGVGEPLATERCVQAGKEIAGEPGRTALLVMGDASACRTLKAPGYLDERAAPFDEEVARALGSADVAALKALDAELAYDLRAAGRAPWQILAGAAEGAGLDGALLHDSAPYGVGYLVAVWS
ncbi:class III extradiol dioxygenase subunit B-like domain-containing protein [Streptomyces sp. SID1121]|uniref:class III extradiol dioxygenase subunit B-like domain-containing protein n=1 Tax=Streptomyces sp. SID1121 TaxID=3425888 RepID=UPI0040562AB1